MEEKQLYKMKSIEEKLKQAKEEDKQYRDLLHKERERSIKQRDK